MAEHLVREFETSHKLALENLATLEEKEDVAKTIKVYKISNEADYIVKAELYWEWANETLEALEKHYKHHDIIVNMIEAMKKQIKQRTPLETMIQEGNALRILCIMAERQHHPVGHSTGAVSCTACNTTFRDVGNLDAEQIPKCTPANKEKETLTAS